MIPRYVKASECGRPPSAGGVRFTAYGGDANDLQPAVLRAHRDKAFERFNVILAAAPPAA